MKNKTTAAILAFFLGGIGIHRFYLGQAGLGILYLVFCWTFVPALIALIDFICFLATSTQSFDQKYNKQPQQPMVFVNNAPPPPSGSKADELAKLHDLKVKGALTEDEYAREKAKVMA